MNEGLEALQEKIEKLIHMVEENNTMLKSVQRRAKVTILISSIKWLFILGVTFGSFIFLQPFLDNAFSAYNSISELSNPFSKNTKDSTDGSSTSGQEENLIDALRTYLPR